MIEPKSAILFRNIHHVKLHLDRLIVNLFWPLTGNVVLLHLLLYFVDAEITDIL
jgi:hypothetical protein